MPDLEFAHAVLVLDCDPSTTRRSSTCACARASAAAASSSRSRRAGRPRSTPARACSLRFAPGAGGALLAALDAAFSDDAGLLGGAATAAGSNAQSARDLAELLSGVGEDVVILYGERLLSGPRGADAARALLNVATRLGLARPPRRRAARGAGLGQRPRPARGRVRPWPRRRATRRSRPPAATRPASPRASPRASSPRSTCCTPTRCAIAPDRAKWEAALDAAQTVIAHESVPHRDRARARRRRLPGRGLRREGGHAHAPRRARPAPAPGDRAPAPRRDARQRGARRLAGAGRGGAPCGPRARRAAPGRWPPTSCSPPCRSTPGSRSTRSAGAACAGPRPRRPPASRRRAGSSPSWRSRRPRPSPNGALRLGTFRSIWAARRSTSRRR